MRCNVCGSEIKQGEEFCGNCGTRVNEMNSSFGSANNFNSNTYNGMDNFNQGMGAVSRKNQNSGSRKIISAIIIIICAVLVYGGRYYYKNIMTKTIDGTGYTIELPATMKDNISADVTLTDSFMNNDVLVNVEVLSYADLGGTDDIKGMSVMDMYTILKLYGSKDISFDSCDGHYIYYSQSAYGKKWYGLCAMKENDDGYYFFEFGCENNNSEKYRPKFKKWAETVDFT